MARQYDGSTRDIAYALADQFMLLLGQAIMDETDMFIHNVNPDDCDDVEYLEWQGAMDIQNFITEKDGAHWVELTDYLANQLEYWFTGHRDFHDINPFDSTDPDDNNEDIARVLINIAMMLELHTYPQHLWYEFLQRGNEEYVPQKGSFLPAYQHAPTQLDAPINKPMSLLDMAANHKKFVQRNNDEFVKQVAEIAPPAEQAKLLAPGGFFDRKNAV